MLCRIGPKKVGVIFRASVPLTAHETSENLQAEKSACEHRLRFDKMQTFYKSCTYSKLNYENVAYFLSCSSRKISLIYIMHDFIFVQRESPICESIFLNYYAPSFD